MTDRVRSARFDELAVETFHDIVRLRVDVFVVEQECAYPELDGLDLEAVHYWVEGPEGIAAYLRVVDEGDRRRIGRVVTHPAARRRSLARGLMEHVMAETSGPWFLSAQTYLRDWYGHLGFVEVGEEYVEGGIPHVDMERLPR